MSDVVFLVSATVGDYSETCWWPCAVCSSREVAEMAVSERQAAFRAWLLQPEHDGWLDACPEPKGPTSRWAYSPTEPVYSIDEVATCSGIRASRESNS